MDLDARPYRSFIAVADTGSFSRAAETLHVSQPALSAQIKEFERRLGFPLFARSSRKVTLTTEGRLFLDRARRLVTETDWANTVAREIRGNQLRIGVAHHTASIAERNALIDDFMVAAPDVPLRVIRRSPAQLLQDLGSGDVDVALLLDFEGTAAGHAETAFLQRSTIATRALRLWVPAEHPLATARIVPAATLKGLTVGMIDRSHGIAIAEGVGRTLVQAGAELRWMPEGDAQSVLRQCARLRQCAIDLGWFPSGEDTMCSVAVEGWKVGITLVVLAPKGDRREGAERFLSRINGPVALD